VELQAVFIRHALMVGSQAPARTQFFPGIQAQGNVGVANVYCK